MTSRRRFLEVTATAGVGSMLPWRFARAAPASPATATAAAAMAPGVVVSPLLPKFVDAFTTTQFTPPVAKPGPDLYLWKNPFTGEEKGIPWYHMSIGANSQQLHNILGTVPQVIGPTPVWGYSDNSAGSKIAFPGPTIEAQVDEPIAVRWINTFPADAAHILPVDTRFDGAMDYPQVRFVTHLHGGHVPWTSDGGPLGWYTTSPPLPGGAYPKNLPNGMPATGKFFTGDTFVYPNYKQNPDGMGATLWYHDHAMAVTRLNVYAGLAGFYLLRDPDKEALLGLPSGPGNEVPIAIQDRTFDPTPAKLGHLYYPPPPNPPEWFGDTIVVNGVVWPRLKVDAKKYRFRLLNGCNSRVLRMRLIEATATGAIPNGPSQWVLGPVFQQIGTDGGYLPSPVPMQVLTMAPGERCDVVIDFSKAFGNAPYRAGRKAWFLLHNDAATPFSNTASTAGAVPELMLFEVSQLPTVDRTPLPAQIGTVTPLVAPAGATVRDLTLDEFMTPGGLVALLTAQYYMDPDTHALVPSTENPPLGATEVWNLVNLTPDTHPIHLHQTMFQLVSRTPFDARRYQRDKMAGALQPLASYFTGPAALATAFPNEMGWKDTIRANPGEVTQIIAKFENYEGRYVWHCHILEHEDNEMMRPLEVGGPFGPDENVPA